MIGLDTNVLVRFFTMDDPEQSRRARSLMNSLSAAEPGWVAVASLLELVWVMKSAMRRDRFEIANALSNLMVRDSIVIEHMELIERSLHSYRTGRADFADCLIAASARAAGCSRTVTFDRVAARDAGMELLA